MPMEELGSETFDTVNQTKTFHYSMSYFDVLYCANSISMLF